MQQSAILVVGACGLIGKAISKHLVTDNQLLLLSDIEADNDIIELVNDGNQTRFFEVDITDQESISELMDAIIEQNYRLDGMVNLAYPKSANYGKRLEQVDADQMNQNLTLQLGSTFAICKAVCNIMTQNKDGGAIVTFGSTYGVQAPDFTVYEGTDMTSPVEYAAIKGGVLNLTRYLASYYGPEGVRVNAVSPGGVFDDQDPRFVRQYEERVPLGRMAQPEDIAGAVRFLLSDEAAYITGHNLVVDGGWTIK